jgi:hypothetical protein
MFRAVTAITRLGMRSHQGGYCPVCPLFVGSSEVGSEDMARAQDDWMHRVLYTLDYSRTLHASSEYALKRWNLVGDKEEDMHHPCLARWHQYVM